MIVVTKSVKLSWERLNELLTNDHAFMDKVTRGGTVTDDIFDFETVISCVHSICAISHFNVYLKMVCLCYDKM